MADVFTDLAAQTLGVASLIEPLLAAQLLSAPFVSEATTIPADLDRPFELDSHAAPQALEPHLSADRLTASRTLQPSTLDSFQLREPAARIALVSSATATAADEVAWSALDRHSASIAREAADTPDLPPSSSTPAQPAAPKPHKTRTRDRYTMMDHELSAWLVPSAWPSDAVRHHAPQRLGEEPSVPARSHSHTLEAQAAITTSVRGDSAEERRLGELSTAHADARTIQAQAAGKRALSTTSLPAHTVRPAPPAEAASASASIESQTGVQTSASKTALPSRTNRLGLLPIDRDRVFATRQHFDLFSLIAPETQATHTHTRVQPRIDPIPETLRLSAHLDRSTTNDQATKPTVRVIIGRVEVRSSQAATSAPGRQRLISSRPRLSLNDYLRQRRGAP